MFASNAFSQFTHRKSVIRSVVSIHLRHKTSWVNPIVEKACGIAPHGRAARALYAGAHASSCCTRSPSTARR